ncbi:response regulator [Ponticoccus sp. (in: a-proteobacteria)]|uniref:response regulator n=1 Tax=Ponticoccus sp. (in: a-proteobacteria) TaxID=1925025 RepID=UPI003AB1BD6B
MITGQKSMPINILLVEDDNGDAKAVIRAFKRAQIANPIVRARDGREALEILHKQRPDMPEAPFICLVDVNMPRMNGHEFVAALRADPDLRKLVVFMLTTSKMRDDVDHAYDNNVAGYIVKESAGADFLDLIGTLNAYWRLVELPDMP